MLISRAVSNISVAIPNWNGELILPRCLASLRRAAETAGLGPVLDTVIADDQSTDRGLAAIRRDFPNVRVIEMKQRSGFGVTANTAVANCAHNCDTKQTVLGYKSTLGSLINFCNVLMLGGTSPGSRSARRSAPERSTSTSSRSARRSAR